MQSSASVRPKSKFRDEDVTRIDECPERPMSVASSCFAVKKVCAHYHPMYLPLTSDMDAVLERIESKVPSRTFGPQSSRGDRHTELPPVFYPMADGLGAKAFQINSQSDKHCLSVEDGAVQAENIENSGMVDECPAGLVMLNNLAPTCLVVLSACASERVPANRPILALPAMFR